VAVLPDALEMVLAESDIAIAPRYAELISDSELRDRVFSRLRVEWQTVVDALLRIMGQESCSKATRLLARSIRNRFPYLDPLNHMQIELCSNGIAPATRMRTSSPGST